MNKKPNIIYILADDMGYGDVSCLNEHAGFKTPNIDSIYENGVAFCDAHASSAVCTPSRYGIVTGRYNWRSKLKSDVLGGYSSHLIERDTVTVADILKKNGYKTYAVGKWHLGMDFAKTEDFMEFPKFQSSYDLNDGIEYDKKIEQSPIDNGFDYFYGIAASLDMPPYVYIENNYFTDKPDHIAIPKQGGGWFRRGPASKDFVHEEVLDVLCDKVLDIMSNTSKDPYFIYFPMPAPHGPIMPGKEFEGKSNTNRYGDFVLHCDAVVGRIIDKLKENDAYEDTLLIFASDNGCSPIANFEELLAKGHNPNYVFRGAKADIYEGGHRVPLLVQLPSEFPSKRYCDCTVCLTDFMATISEMIGYELKENEGVDSVSNYSLLLNADAKEVRQYTVSQSFDGSLSITDGQYKLIMCSDSGGWNPKPWVKGEPRFQLYNMKKDIGEKNNIINDMPEVYEKLKKELIGCIVRGRSTEGKAQHNNGQQVWNTISWIEKENDYNII